MSETQKNAWLLIAAVASPIILILTIILDIGGDRQRLNTVITEVAIIRKEMRERTRDRIHRDEHDRDVETLRKEISDIRRRITRNETWIYGGDDSGANGR